MLQPATIGGDLVRPVDMVVADGDGSVVAGRSRRTRRTVTMTEGPAVLPIEMASVDVPCPDS